MHILPSNKLSFWASWAIAFALFLPWLPSTVQYGDSGELVGNAITLTLSHPPGFPLFHWIYHFFLKIPLPLTPYHQAALLTAAMLSSALALIVRRLPLMPAICLAAFLALQPVVLRQALLPDVFALHALLVVAAIQVALSSLSAGQRFFYFAVLMAAAGANHPTAIFLLPLALVFWRDRPRVVVIVASVFCAVALFTGLYLSLMLFDRMSPFAWPAAHGLSGLWKHILRAEYGSFQLSAHGTGASVVEVYEHFLQHLCLPLIAFAALLWIGRKNGKVILSGQRKYLLLLLLYAIGFYALANVRPAGFGAFVLERFHLYPLILAGLALAGLLECASTVAWRHWALVPLVAASAFWSIPQNQWQKDTVLEDLITNLHSLATTGSKSCSALLLSGDSPWTAYAYFASTQNFPVNPLPISKGILVVGAYQEKLLASGLELHRRASDQGETFDLAEDLILPNLKRCDFFTLDPLVNQKFLATALPLGRRISEGSGLQLSTERGETLLIRSAPAEARAMDSLSQHFFAYYAELPLLMGTAEARNGNWQGAKSWFERAVSVAPYLESAKKNLCEARKQLGETAEECRRD